MGTIPTIESDQLLLYHFDRSSAARKVRLALEEKGLAWKSQLLNTSVAHREHLQPEYLTLNPRGVVPTLIHRGRVVRESQVILEYLEDVFPEPSLRPSDPYERAQMRLWTRLSDEGLHLQSRTLAICSYMGELNKTAGADAVSAYYAATPEPQRRQNDLVNIAQGLNSPLLATAVAYFKNAFHEIDAALFERQWLTGETYSLADISMGVYVTRLTGLGMASLWDDFEQLNEWHERFKQRPSYQLAVREWGDRSSAERSRLVELAFPAIKSLWEAA